MTVRDFREEFPARVVVTKVGRRWNIIIKHGLMEIGPGYGGSVFGWYRWGENRARRKAEKVLKRYLKKFCGPPAQSFEVCQPAVTGSLGET